MKQKPNSYGGCSGKILENKILDNIIKEFRRDRIKNQEQNIQNNTLGKTNNQQIIMNGNNFNSIGGNFRLKASILNQTDYSAYLTYTNSNPNHQINPFAPMFQPKVIQENRIVLTQTSTNNNEYNHLSEKEEESSSATKETILQKPNDFSISNSFSNRNNNSTSNNQTENGINISNSIRNDSLNFDSSIKFQSSNKSQSKDSSLSRSSIIFQPQKEHRTSNQNSNNNSKYLYNPIAVLKYHLDTVRGVYINPTQKILVSVSEDSLICFWDLEKALKHHKENPEPYMTLRNHTTSIFTLTGPKIQTYPFEAVYSSGVDGVIRANKIPNLKTHDKEEITTDGTLLPWRAHQDMIWQLDYHPKKSLMSSVSSDGTVKIFKCYEEVNTDKHYYYSYDSSSKNLLRNFMFRNHVYNFIEIPTSSAWSTRKDNMIFVSHIASYIKIYDIETGQTAGDISYSVEKNIPFESQQANKIISHNNGTICTGHEDRQIRFFDINTSKQTNSFVAHADSISCLSNGINEFELLSASHDGSVRCWDLRTNKLIFDIPAHRKKYDEGCLFLTVIPLDNLMITSGSDGIIKLFCL